MDASIVGFSAMQWQRGRVSFLFRGDPSNPAGTQLLALDHIKHTKADLLFRVTAYRQFCRLLQQREAERASDPSKPALSVEEGAAALGLDADRTSVLQYVHSRHQMYLEDKVDALLGSALPLFDWWSRDVTFSRDVSWWSKAEVAETVGDFPCAVYSMQGLQLRVDSSPPIWPDRRAVLEERQKARAEQEARPPSAGAELKQAIGGLRSILGLGGAAEAGSLPARAEALAHQLQASAGEEVTHETWRQAALKAATDVAGSLQASAVPADEALVQSIACPPSPAEDTESEPAEPTSTVELVAGGGAAAAAAVHDPALLQLQLGVHRALAAQGWAPAGVAPVGDAGEVVEVTWNMEGQDAVSAGDFSVIAVPLISGAEATWSVTVQKHDVGVHAVFAPSTTSLMSVLGGGDVGEVQVAVERLAAPRNVDSRAKAGATTASFTAPVGGTLVLLLDNTYAMWHTKKVTVHMQVTLPTLAALVEALSVPGGPLADFASSLRGEAAAGAGRDQAGAGKAEGKEVDGPFMLPPGCKWVEGSFASVFGKPIADVLAAPAVGPVLPPPSTLPGNADQGEVGVAGEASLGQSTAAPRVPDLPAEWEGKTIGQVLAQLAGKTEAEVAASLPSQRPMAKQRAPKRYTKSISAKVKMSDTFPLPVTYLLPVLEAVSRTSAHMENASRFLHTKLPPGFPVAFDVPVVPAVSAQVQFLAAAVGEQDPALFEVPDAYKDCTHELPGGKYMRNLGRVADEKAAAKAAAKGTPAAASP